MNRRGFLQACLASATAPYVVTDAGVLMPIKQIQTYPAGWVDALTYNGALDSYAMRWIAISNIAKFKLAGWDLVDWWMPGIKPDLNGYTLMQIPKRI